MTEEQEKLVKIRLNLLMSLVIWNTDNREKFVNTILNDIINDINETADWSMIRPTEIRFEDVVTSLDRILLRAFNIK